VPTPTLTEDELDATFAALADPTRRAILARLAAGDATVNELAEPFALSLPAISKHLKVLERSGLISRARRAQFRRATSSPRRLDVAVDWIDATARSGPNGSTGSSSTCATSRPKPSTTEGNVMTDAT
jgi:DNA-binding transcriptional ArsR family regulator